MRGAGNAGRRGAPAGDLRVEIEEKPHKYLTREGNDILYDAWVSFPDAALGTEIDVPTLRGWARLEVDPGVQSGRTLRMRDRGLPDLNSGRKADQLVTFHVWTPKELPSELREKLEELRNNEALQPKPDEGTSSKKSFFRKVKDAFT